MDALKHIGLAKKGGRSPGKPKQRPKKKMDQ